MLQLAFGLSFCCAEFVAETFGRLCLPYSCRRGGRFAFEDSDLRLHPRRTLKAAVRGKPTALSHKMLDDPVVS